MNTKENPLLHHNSSFNSFDCFTICNFPLPSLHTGTHYPEHRGIYIPRHTCLPPTHYPATCYSTRFDADLEIHYVHHWLLVPFHCFQSHSNALIGGVAARSGQRFQGSCLPAKMLTEAGQSTFHHGRVNVTQHSGHRLPRKPSFRFSQYGHPNGRCVCQLERVHDS